MATIRIMVIENRLIIREGLKQMLVTATDMAVIAEAASAAAALMLMADRPCDFILLGNDDRWTDELTAVDSIKSRYPQVHLMLVFDVIRSGFYDSPLTKNADCYVPMSIAGVELAYAIRKIVKTPAGMCQEKPLATSASHSFLQHLSSREIQVVALIASGKNITQIAPLMGLSSKTVSTYRSRALDKLGYSNTAQLMLYGIKNGLVG